MNRPARALARVEPQIIKPTRTDHGAVVAAMHGLSRSPEWPRVEKAHLQLQPRCVCCAAHARPTAVQVHHIFPFHYCIALGRPDLELDLRNLITLCESEAGRPAEDHHLLVGHLNSFRSSNLEVSRDAHRRFHALHADAIRKLPAWLREVSRRLAPLDEMTREEKRAFAELMNTKLPRRAR